MIQAWKRGRVLTDEERAMTGVEFFRRHGRVMLWVQWRVTPPQAVRLEGACALFLSLEGGAQVSPYDNRLFFAEREGFVEKNVVTVEVAQSATDAESARLGRVLRDVYDSMRADRDQIDAAARFLAGLVLRDQPVAVQRERETHVRALMAVLGKKAV